MTRVVRLLRRALGRSPAELAFRARQQARIALERAAIASGGGPAGAPRGWAGVRGLSMLEQLRGPGRPSFFAGLDDRAETVALLRSRFPDEVTRVIGAAERIGNGRFDLLGYRDLDFGSPPDWHLDPILGIRAPAEPHWSTIDFLDPGVAGDHKLVWELNRHQYLVTLGQAWWCTGDERHVRTFIAHLASWMDHNPPRRGINWASSLEVAFRAISWLWALHFFRDAPGLTDPLVRRMLGFLQEHGRHIERHLSTYFSPNTHLTGEALGLFYLGTLLPELPESRRWQRRAVAVFAAEMARQVRPDGVYFEQATWYHRYTADFLVHLLLLAERNGIPGCEQHGGVLDSMLDHVLALTRPDGTVPLMGDDDGGCLLPLDGPPTADFRSLLATGAILRGRGDCRLVAGDALAPALWLTGAAGLEAYDSIAATPPGFTSRGFVDSGLYVMRDGWDATANYLVMDAGPHGALSGGHAHADALAVNLSCGAQNVLVDAGTGSYTADPGLRDRFRSTPAHNTLCVDGRSSSEPGAPFRWQTQAGTVMNRWVTHARFDFLDARHDGWARIVPQSVHRRQVLFVRGECWLIRDRMPPAPGHVVESRLHFDPSLDVGLRQGQIALGSAGGGHAHGWIVTAGTAGAPVLEPCEVSDAYGSVRPATRAVVKLEAGAEADLVTLVLPLGTTESRVETVEVSGGAAFRVHRPSCVDWIIAGPLRGAEVGVSTDFAWAWVRTCPASGDVLDYLAVDGSSLSINGRSIVQEDAATEIACMGAGAAR